MRVSVHGGSIQINGIESRIIESMGLKLRLDWAVDPSIAVMWTEDTIVFVGLGRDVVTAIMDEIVETCRANGYPVEVMK